MQRVLAGLVDALLDVSRSIDAEIFHGFRSILQHEARYPLAEVV